MATSQAPGERDPFIVLGVSRDCTPETLRRAYRALARRYHPDVNADAAAAARMQEINAAFAAAQRDVRARARAEAMAAVAANTPQRGVGSVAGGPPAAPSPLREDITEGAHARNVRTHVHPAGMASGVPNVALREWLARWRKVAAQQWLRLAERRRGEASATWALPLRIVGVLAASAAPLLLLLALARSGWIGMPGAAASMTDPALHLGGVTGLQWAGMERVALAERLVARLPAGIYQSPSWSFDGQYAAVSYGDSAGHANHPSILVLDAHGLVVRSFDGFAARWAPHAEQLAMLALPAGSTVPQLELADVATGTVSVLVAKAGNHLAWSPDGLALAYSAQGQRALRLLDVQTLHARTIYALPGSQLNSHLIPVGWLGGGTIICYEADAKSLQLLFVNGATGALAPLAPTMAGTTLTIAWNAPRGQIVYAAQTPGQPIPPFTVVNRATGARQAISSLHGAALLAGWSDDNEWLGAANAVGPPGGPWKSAVCLVMTPSGLPIAAWAAHCLAVGGRLDGLAWQHGAARLTYLRQPAAGADEEVRELTITPDVNQVSGPASWHGAVQLARMPGLGGALALLVSALSQAAIGWRRSRDARDTDGDAAGIRPQPPGESGDAGTPLRIAVLSEALKWPPDEALKRTALELALGLERHATVLAVGTRGRRHGGDQYPALALRANRTYVSWRLWRQLWRFRPNVVCYLPGSGLTLFSLLRAVVLRLACLLQWRRPVLVLVSIQPREQTAIVRWLLRATGPVLVVVQSPQRRAAMASMGITTYLLAAGIDPERFHPASPMRRVALRQALGIARDVPVVLHVGHLKWRRNVAALAALKRRLPSAEVILVASTSTVTDSAVKTELSRAGVRIIDHYLPRVEELYQIADCYVFPVQDTQNSAEFPLSVLEALACGLPVVSTRFGALPDCLPSDGSMHYIDAPEHLPAVVAATIGAPHSAQLARQVALRYSWAGQVAHLVEAIRGLLPAGNVTGEAAASATPEEVAGE